jgi:ribosomal RNA-processing protein 9
VFTASKDCCLI